MGTHLPTRTGLALRMLVALLGVTSAVALVAVTGRSTVGLVTLDGGQRATQPSIEATSEVTADAAPALDPTGEPVVPLDIVLPTSALGRGSATTRPAAESPPAPLPQRPGTIATTARPPDGVANLDTGLWISDGQGALRLMSPEQGWVPLAWAPNSTEVAVGRGDSLWLFTASSGSRRQLLSRPGMTVTRGAWSPDGRSVAVLLSDPASYRPRLYVIGVADGAVTEVPVLNLMTNLAYTPNGCLALADSIDGTTGISLTCPGQPRRLIPLRIGGVAVSLGAAGLAYTESGPSGLSVVDAEGLSRPGVAGEAHLYGFEIAWDQANGTILWNGSHNGPTPRTQLYASRPGGATATISRCTASPPTVSANGTLVYVDCTRSTQAVLQRHSGPEVQPRVVAKVPYSRAVTPLISPDSRWLIAALSPF